MISTLCRCLLSLNIFGSQMGSKNITSSTSFMFTVFTFSLKSHAHHPDERTAYHWPAKFNLYLRKWGSKERHTTIHICWQFSRSNRVWIFGLAHYLVFLPWSSNRVFSWSAWTSKQVSHHCKLVVLLQCIGKFGLLWPLNDKCNFFQFFWYFPS